jgi:16S rRNA (adenine1518-N6/adenine1519-N6)-dimethyltransferase
MPVLSPTDIRGLLTEHGLHPSRALGQHFLADPNIAARIVRLAGIASSDRVLEIGPGLGSLTLALAGTGAHVLAVEVDRHLVPVLQSVVAGAGDVVIEQGDALVYDFAARLGPGPWSCVSNLPYNVATPVVVRLLEEVPQVAHIVVMVQREVGERLAAQPGTRAAGAVSVKVAFHADARLVGTVPPAVFVPRPKVDSVLVSLQRRAAPPVAVAEPDVMFGLVRSAFAQRRKMLRRSLRPALGDRTDQVLAAAAIDPRARPEVLDLAAWAALAQEVAS